MSWQRVFELWKELTGEDLLEVKEKMIKAPEGGRK